jgi:hypothetical protein
MLANQGGSLFNENPEIHVIRDDGRGGAGIRETNRRLLWADVAASSSLRNRCMLLFRIQLHWRHLHLRWYAVSRDG